MTSDMHRTAYGVDPNGRLTEDVELAGGSVRIHYGDVPESDITTVDGLRVTTPLRTVIDLAAEVTPAELERMIQICLARSYFSIDEAIARLGQPDMTTWPGARVLRRHLGLVDR